MAKAGPKARVQRVCFTEYEESKYGRERLSTDEKEREVGLTIEQPLKSLEWGVVRDAGFVYPIIDLVRISFVFPLFGGVCHLGSCLNSKGLGKSLTWMLKASRTPSTPTNHLEFRLACELAEKHYTSMSFPLSLEFVRLRDR